MVIKELFLLMSFIYRSFSYYTRKKTKQYKGIPIFDNRVEENYQLKCAGREFVRD